MPVRAPSRASTSSTSRSRESRLQVSLVRKPSAWLSPISRDGLRLPSISRISLSHSAAVRKSRSTKRSKSVIGTFTAPGAASSLSRTPVPSSACCIFSRQCLPVAATRLRHAAARRKCNAKRRSINTGDADGGRSGPEALDQAPGNQVPAVDEDEEHQLERQRDDDRWQHHHAHRHECCGDHHLADDEWHEQEKADLEGAAQLGDPDGGAEAGEAPLVRAPGTP